MRGKMWRVIKEMYSVSRSAVLLVVVRLQRNYCSNIHCILNAISVLDRKRLSLHLVHCTIWFLSTQLVHKPYTASTQLVRNELVQSY